MVFELAKMASTKLARRQRVRALASAESEFRTQPVTTAVSATGDADIKPTQTHANALFFSYMHHGAFSAHFQCGNTTLAQGEKEFVSHSSALMSIPLDTSLLNVPFSRFPQVLSSPACPTSQTSATSSSFCGSRNNPCASARWGGMSGRMANPTQNTGSRVGLNNGLLEKICSTRGRDHCPQGGTRPCKWRPSSTNDSTVISKEKGKLFPVGRGTTRERESVWTKAAEVQGKTTRSTNGVDDGGHPRQAH